MKKVLIVDDFSSIGTMMGATLKMNGFDSSYAKNGQEALHLVEKEPEQFSLIISDLNMPEMNGMQLLEAIRKHKIPKVSRLPFILISTKLEADLLKEAKKLGLTNWVQKPYKNDRFLTTVKDAILK